MVDIWGEEKLNRASAKGEANKPREGERCTPRSHVFERIEPVAGYDFACINCGVAIQDDEYEAEEKEE